MNVHKQFIIYEQKKHIYFFLLIIICHVPVVKIPYFRGKKMVYRKINMKEKRKMGKHGNFVFIFNNNNEHRLNETVTSTPALSLICPRHMICQRSLLLNTI